MMLPACGAVNFDTHFSLALAPSVSGPGCIVPNVDAPAIVTVIDTGELVDDAP